MRAPLRALVLDCQADDLAVAIAARWRRRHGDEALTIVALLIPLAPAYAVRVYQVLDFSFVVFSVCCVDSFV